MRFYDVIGYGQSVEDPPGGGVWVDQMIEFAYYGDVIRDTRKLESTENLNDDITVGNSLSLVADEYAVQHIFDMRYAKWAGAYWTVTDVEVRSPRLIVRLGKVYNGPKA